MKKKQGLGLILLLFASVGTTEERSHQESLSSTSGSESRLIHTLGFQAEVHREVITNRNEELSIHLEDGIVRLDGVQQKLARRIYQGRRASPNGQLDLIATDAGKARTFISAVRACEKLIPLGQWKLASIEHIMAFFGDLLPGYPLPDHSNQKGYLFWAHSPGLESDPKNKDAFFTTPELGGEKIEVQHFTQFTNYLRQRISSARSKKKSSIMSISSRKLATGFLSSA